MSENEKDKTKQQILEEIRHIQERVKTSTSLGEKARLLKEWSDKLEEIGA